MNEHSGRELQLRLKWRKQKGRSLWGESVGERLRVRGREVWLSVRERERSRVKAQTLSIKQKALITLITYITFYNRQPHQSALRQAAAGQFTPLQLCTVIFCTGLCLSLPALKEKTNVLVSRPTLSNQDRELHLVLSAPEQADSRILLFWCVHWQWWNGENDQFQRSRWSFYYRADQEKKEAKRAALETKKQMCKGGDIERREEIASKRTGS